MKLPLKATDNWLIYHANLESLRKGDSGRKKYYSFLYNIYDNFYTIRWELGSDAGQFADFYLLRLGMTGYVISIINPFHS